MHNRAVALSELLPPDHSPSDVTNVTDLTYAPDNADDTGGTDVRDVADGGPPTRRQVRARRRRRSRGPILAGLALMVAAGVGSVAALAFDPPGRTGADGDLAAFPDGEVSPSVGDLGSSPVPLVPSSLEGADAGAEGGDAKADGAGQSAARKEAAVPRRISEVGSRPARTSAAWPALTYTLKASTTTEEPLRFPGAIIGFRLADSSVSRVSLSESKYFAAVGDLPVRTASYEECREQRFYVRWMAEDPDAVVEATFVDEHVRTVQNRPVSGSSGWQSSYGCVQPALRIRTPAGANPAGADVLVETQVWRQR